MTFNILEGVGLHHLVVALAATDNGLFTIHLSTSWKQPCNAEAWIEYSREFFNFRLGNEEDDNDISSYDFCSIISVCISY